VSTQIILHNYPQSPVAEKVRVAFGLKGLAWSDVEIPRLPPKPMLTALTGGYRRTPVMQIGADIFCDSQCILREVDRRFPEKPFMPTADAGLLWCLSRWTDGALFDLAVKIVLGAAGDKLDPEFAKDRGQLYLGNDWVAGLKAANAQLPHLVSQLRAPLSWLDSMLSDDRPFLTGDQPSALDAQVYHVVWFVRGRWEGGAAALGEFEHLCRWEAAIKAIGHGQVSPLTPEEAIKVAAAATPQTEEAVHGMEPQGLTCGMTVSVCPDVPSNEQAVQGRLRFASADTFAIDRHSDETGSVVCVHFPRSGYRVDVLS
jgi:glutathione S-transferase